MLARMILRLVPLIAGILPILTINTCYVIAVKADMVPACIPYLEGCTSVSATGRYPPASYLFRAVMLPQSVVLMVYWGLCVAWLRQFSATLGKPANTGTAIGVLGVGGATFLILYVTFLGSQEPFYELMRRFGVYLYFGLSVIAQLVLGFKVLPLARILRDRMGDPLLIRVTRLQLALALVPFALGVLNLVLKATLTDPDAAENMIEWIFALLMQLYFVLTYYSWRQTGFSGSFSVALPGRD